MKLSQLLSVIASTVVAGASASSCSVYQCTQNWYANGGGVNYLNSVDNSWYQTSYQLNKQFCNGFHNSYCYRTDNCYESKKIWCEYIRKTGANPSYVQISGCGKYGC